MQQGNDDTAKSTPTPQEIQRLLRQMETGRHHTETAFGESCASRSHAHESGHFFPFWASHLVSLSRTRINTTIELNRLPYRDRREYQIAKDTVEPLVQSETPLI